MAECAQLHTGSVTFLFSDMEGSTRLWEKHPEVMQVALARHDVLLRETIEAHGGYIFKTVGDAFCAAFHTAPAGLEASLAIQRALLVENWGETPIRVRVALHTGNAQERDGDYFGPSLNRVARLLSAGHGGQILISAVTQELVRDQLTPGVSLNDLGERRLKDLDRAERIFQLVVPGLPADFPPLKTLESFPNNLPLQLTSFVGREKEIAEVKRLLGAARLLTLTGPGGTGKTRLSLQVAADLLDRFPDGVWLVELAVVSDPALVPQTVASVLSVREEPGTPLIKTLTDYLRAKSLLLIMDNCEHLIGAAAQLVETLLRTCPHLQVLASSREALGIAGETSFRVPALSAPTLQSPALWASDLQSLTQYEAVWLFIDRAVAVRAEFQVTNANAPALAQICCRLDGIPLAIELAAAKMRAMSVEQIAARLDDRFRLLTGGSRTALPRQQTLRALIDWSYDLLGETERVLLCRLSVFAGSWALEAAEMVCGDDDTLPAVDVLDVLTRLVDKSLVVAEEQSGETRYRLLETIRQYARDKLLESGEDAQIRTRHLDFFLRLAEEVEPKLRGPAQYDGLKRLEIAHDNLRSALEWSTSAGYVERGMRLASALLQFWDMRDYRSEGKESTQNLLQQSEALPKTLLRANTLYVWAFLAGLDEQKLAQEYLEEAIRITREQGVAGKRTLALALGEAGLLIHDDDPVTAQSMVEEGLAIAQSLGDPWYIALALYRSGSLFVSQLDHAAARMRDEESFKLFEILGDRRWAASVSSSIAHEDIRQGDFAEARLRYQQILPFLREEKYKSGITSALNALGVMAHAEGNYALAKGYYAEALANARDLGSGIFSPAKNLGNILLYEGEIESAKTLAAECMSLARQSGSKAVLSYAIQSYAGIATVQKQARKAITLFAVTRKLQEEAASKGILSPAGEADFARNFALAREQVDDATFNAAWAEGRAMTWEQAVAYALGENREASKVTDAERSGQ